jgi:hypothetical protein
MKHEGMAGAGCWDATRLAILALKPTTKPAVLGKNGGKRDI